MCRAGSASWSTARHNWPTVIAGEVGLGLLAAWEAVSDGPGALSQVVERIAAPLLTYPGDGSYEEGPGYWHYGLGECLPLCEALWVASAGGVDLFSLPFLARTGDYGLHLRTPDGGCFDVEDGASRWAAGWMLAVLGRRTGRPGVAAAGEDCLGTPAGGPALRQLTLVAPAAAGDRAARPGGPVAPATMAFFPGTQNAMLRSDWTPRAFFAGLHAGSNAVNHAHLDLGTFTVGAAGERVLGDSGSWGYTLDYFRGGPGGPRWDYEPNATAGHNALLIDGAGQDPLPAAECRFHQVQLQPEAGLALLSMRLTAAHGGRLQDYLRHFAVFTEGLVVVIDLVLAAEPRRLAWCAHPTAAPEPLGDDGPGWTWRAGGAAAELRLLSLDDREGFVLSEAARHTRYRDRTGRARAYTTQAVRAATLHPATAWRVVAVLRAGPAGALPEARLRASGSMRRDRPPLDSAHVFGYAGGGRRFLPSTLTSNRLAAAPTDPWERKTVGVRAAVRVREVPPRQAWTAHIAAPHGAKQVVPRKGGAAVSREGSPETVGANVRSSGGLRRAQGARAFTSADGGPCGLRP